jgi:hypothetical protein
MWTSEFHFLEEDDLGDDAFHLRFLLAFYGFIRLIFHPSTVKENCNAEQYVQFKLFNITYYI